MIKVSSEYNSELIRELVKRNFSSVGNKSYYISADEKLAVKIGITVHRAIVLDMQWDGDLSFNIIKLKELIKTLNGNFHDLSSRLIASKSGDIIEHNDRTIMNYINVYNLECDLDASVNGFISVSDDIYVVLNNIHRDISTRFNITPDEAKSTIGFYAEKKLFMYNDYPTPIYISSKNDTVTIVLHTAISELQIREMINYVRDQYKHRIFIKTVGFMLNIPGLTLVRSSYLFV